MIKYFKKNNKKCIHKIIYSKDIIINNNKFYKITTIHNKNNNIKTYI